jgi:hypothetical protein
MKGVTAIAIPGQGAILASEAEARVAQETSRLLASRLKKGAPIQLRILDDNVAQGTVKLPATAVGLLLRILEEMARGNAVTIIPVHELDVAAAILHQRATQNYVKRQSANLASA